MRTGDRYITRNELETAIRKLLSMLGAGKVVQHILLDDGDAEAEAQQEPVEDKVDDYTVEEDDFGKFLTMTNGAGTTKTFTLPAVVAEHIGLYIRFAKLGDGKVVMQASGTDTIDDSSAGGTVYNDLTIAEEPYPELVLRVRAAGKWQIQAPKGAGWRTS